MFQLISTIYNAIFTGKKCFLGGFFTSKSKGDTNKKIFKSKSQFRTYLFIYFLDFVFKVKPKRKSFFSLNQIVGCFCFMMKLKIEKWNFPPGHFFRQMMWKTLSESSWERLFLSKISNNNIIVFMWNRFGINNIIYLEIMLKKNFKGK